MTTLLSIRSSLFNGQGQSSALADRFIAGWRARQPAGRVATRDLANNPVPHLSPARFQAFVTPEAERTPEQQAFVDFSDALIDELQRADVVVLAIPMYNFTVPSVLHAYFDHLARAGVTFRYTAEGAEGLVKGKRAVVFITSGGLHGEDHSLPRFVRQFLELIGIVDVQFVHAEGLAVSEELKANGLAAAEGRIEHLLGAVTAGPAAVRRAEGAVTMAPG